MIKVLAIIVLAIFSILSLGNTGGCETSCSIGLTVEDAVFAKMGADGKFDPVDKAVFQRGEAVYFVLINVANFKKGDDGLNWFDMDIEITDPKGDVILSQKEMLGEDGHVALPRNVASSPYAVFFTTTELEPGSYKFKLTIYDKLGVGKASKSAPFTLE